METVNGQWFMLGCSPDDPTCIHDTEELKNLIRRIGFLPLFSNEVSGFSVEERTLASHWWTDDPSSDPWAWRQILSRDPELAYGKFFGKKAGFVSKEWFPVFANFRRNGYDFDARCDDDLVPYRQKKLMEAFEPDEKMISRGLLSYEARQLGGFGKDGLKNFEGTLAELQMQTYLIMSDFRQKINRKGQAYGWHIAVLETPETKWGYEHVTGAYREDPEQSRQRILTHLQRHFPKADGKMFRQLGI